MKRYVQFDMSQKWERAETEVTLETDTLPMLQEASISFILRRQRDGAYSEYDNNLLVLNEFEEAALLTYLKNRETHRWMAEAARARTPLEIEAAVRAAQFAEEKDEPGSPGSAQQERIEAASDNIRF